MLVVDWIEFSLECENAWEKCFDNSLNQLKRCIRRWFASLRAPCVSRTNWHFIIWRTEEKKKRNENHFPFVPYRHTVSKRETHFPQSFSQTSSILASAQLTHSLATKDNTENKNKNVSVSETSCCVVRQRFRWICLWPQLFTCALPSRLLLDLKRGEFRTAFFGFFVVCFA